MFKSLFTDNGNDSIYLGHYPEKTIFKNNSAFTTHTYIKHTIRAYSALQN